MRSPNSLFRPGLPTAEEYAALFHCTKRAVLRAGLVRLDACKDDTYRRLLCKADLRGHRIDRKVAA